MLSTLLPIPMFVSKKNSVHGSNPLIAVQQSVELTQKSIIVAYATKFCLLIICGPFYQHGLTLIPVWIINYTHYNMWDEIAYPFINFNGATVKV